MPYPCCCRCKSCTGAKPESIDLAVTASGRPSHDPGPCWCESEDLSGFNATFTLDLEYEDEILYADGEPYGCRTRWSVSTLGTPWYICPGSGTPVRRGRFNHAYLELTRNNAAGTNIWSGAIVWDIELLSGGTYTYDGSDTVTISDSGVADILDCAFAAIDVDATDGDCLGTVTVEVSASP